MPLPDERPRQSVANLIGRFEQQNKRPSLPSTPPPPPRHLSNNSVKEAKDKKEWTPKSVMATDAQSVFASASPSAGQDESPPSNLQTSIGVPVDVAAGSSEPPKSPPLKGKPTTAGEATPKPVGTRIPSSPMRSRPSTVPRSPAKSSVKPAPPKSSLPSTSQPLRPQHTGQSVASNVSLPRTPRPTPKFVSLTPSRPKTPATQPRGTTRPKTPAAGPFAPTAASLSRSRNTHHPVPPPVKQVASSSSATERFTKPTAASLSKARTPVSVAPTPSRIARSTSTGVVPRGSVKPKAVLSAAGEKDAKAEGVAKDKPLHSSEPPASELAQGGHAGEDAVLSDAHGSVDISQEGAHNDPVAEKPQGSPPISEPPCQLSDDCPVQDPNPEQPQPVQDSVENGAREDVPEEVCEEQRVVIETAGPHEENLPVDLNGQHADIPASPAIGHDIEDTTSSLERFSIPKPRPQSMITIPDEHLDTSDEY